MLIIGGALALWVVLSLIIIALKYLFHDKVLTIADISRYSNAPILGIVARYRNNIPVSQLIVDKKPKSMMAETFRTIRSNLDFISNEPGSKLIAVTSTISGEGKTFVSINLAGILAFTGKSVIVIDADMRKPKIHIGFSSTNEKGLSTLLIGKDSLENCIRKSELEHLDYITAGPIPPNPSELLLSEKMSALTDELLRRYDYVLIDNPPIGIVTDALTNMVKADYPIYVFRSDYSRRFFINNLERLIHENKITRLSVVLNGVDLRKSNRYGYTYGYGGGYGYGYGNSYGYIHHSFGYYDEEGVIAKRKFSLRGLFKRKRNDQN
jgi:capsular exopolysaccharide synthesis family protein